MIELSCYYSLSSPWAYFGSPKLQDIVRRHRLKLVLKPYDFQEVAPRTGGVPLRTRPEPRRTYHAQERGLDAPLLSHALLRALWAEDRDTSDPAVRTAIANENGLPGAELVAAESSSQVQALYKAYSEEAERLGVFGAPTYVLGGERYWGQDRLDFVDCALERLRPS